MKVAICGSREYMVSLVILTKIMTENNLVPTQIVSGGAKGIDKSAENFAKYIGQVPKVFEADWHKLGRAAGPMRNKEIADYADLLIVIWTGRSSGSKNVKKHFDDLGKKVISIKLEDIDPKYLKFVGATGYPPKTMRDICLPMEALSQIK